MINSFVKLELVSQHTKMQASALQTFADVFVDFEYTNLQKNPKVVVVGFRFASKFELNLSIFRDFYVPDATSVIRVFFGIFWRGDALFLICDCRVVSTAR